MHLRGQSPPNRANASESGLVQSHRLVTGATSARLVNRAPRAASADSCCDSVVDPRSDVFPLLAAKDYAAPALFEPTNLLREARRQCGLPDIEVPTVGLLDPDGDIVRHLAASGRGRRHPGWACYHTEMWTMDLGGIEIGVVGMASATRTTRTLTAVGTHLPARTWTSPTALGVLGRVVSPVLGAGSVQLTGTASNGGVRTGAAARLSDRADPAPGSLARARANWPAQVCVRGR